MPPVQAMPRRSRAVLWIAGALVVVVGLAVGTVIVVRHLGAGSGAGAAECSVPAVAGAPVSVVVQGPVTSGAGATGVAPAHASAAAATTVVSAPDVSLAAVQLLHAATINAVGLRRGLPERARIIAVSTAWQESKLRNVAGGDRDSIGLFQQRPSQGWGTAAQVADPVHASGAFYDALVKVPDWQQMSLTRAAQEVQYSAYPDAYAQWEPAATTLVRALSGNPPELTCTADAEPPSMPDPSRAAVVGAAEFDPRLASLLAAATAELGAVTAAGSGSGGSTATVRLALPGMDADASAAALAAWSVAHATSASGVQEIATHDGTWRDHVWGAAAGQVPPGSVVLTVG